MQRRTSICYAFLCFATIALLWNTGKLITQETMTRYHHRLEVKPIVPGAKPDRRYPDVQLLGDQSTVMYVGYYDNRELQAVVKIPAVFDMEKKIFDITCTLHYPDEDVTKVTAKIRLLEFSWMGNNTKLRYRTAFIICPAYRSLQSPSHVLLETNGIDKAPTNITVIPPASKNNTLTRCIKQFWNMYDNVHQLVWNIEFYRILGVDKQVFYLNNQTQRVVDVLKLYETEGVVELRPFNLGKLRNKPQDLQVQNMVLQDCLLSEMNTAKYVLFTDVDEIVFPRAHRNIVEMADFLFEKWDPKGKKLGSLMFHLAYYPVNTSVTEVPFPEKDIARKYNIDRLLHTARYRSAGVLATKSLVKPRSVDVMFVHVVEKFMNEFSELSVDDDIGVVNHYRKGIAYYLVPPVFHNTEVYRFSERLISAVQARHDEIRRKVILSVGP